jgi:uncharacterized protein (UPF0179 family)
MWKPRPRANTAVCILHMDDQTPVMSETARYMRYPERAKAAAGVVVAATLTATDCEHLLAPSPCRWRDLGARLEFTT